MSSWEGCASISDTNGNLLFYTNGEKVWNRNHQIMPLGDLLFGNVSSTQSSIIIPQPGIDSIYYIFTTDAIGGNGGFRYSIVNMNADGGFGGIFKRNQLLQSPVCEKLTATRHQNGLDVWIVAHGFKNAGKDNLFYSYLLTKDGLIGCPVLTSIGANHYQFDLSDVNAQGAMKFSPDGRRLAVTVYNQWQKYIELFDFDKRTGQISNLVRLTDIDLPYGIEFSPNGKLLYVTNRYNYVWQYDLSLPTATDIRNSQVELFWPGVTTASVHCQIQRAPNGKLYIAMSDSNFLSVINYPDSVGLACDFKLNGLQLSSGTHSQYGLPNFTCSYFYNPKIEFAYSFPCNGTQQATFTAFTPMSVTSWSWQIKHIATSEIYSYSSKQFNHTFSDSGYYSVSLIAGNDTIVKTIYIDAPLLPMADTLGCGLDSVLVNIPASYRCIQWSDTTLALYNRMIRVNGVYSVQGYNSQGCLIKDSINILFNPRPSQPVISKVDDSLYSTSANAYQWYRNDTLIAGANNKGIKPLMAGIYKVVVTDSNGCTNISTGYASNVGVKELNSGGVRVYPNPTTNILIIESKTKLSYRLLDLSGQEYIRGTLNGGLSSVEVGHLCEGMYLLQVSQENANNPQNLKIIVLGK